MREGTAQAIVVMGSNIERERNLPEAIRMLRRSPHIKVEDVSRFYESPSVGGPPDAPAFFNAAALVCTELDPRGLRAALRDIESALGRQRGNDPNAPRTIDLDIAYYGDVEFDVDGWVLPDPMAGTAPHVAIPIAEVAPAWVHPSDGRNLCDGDRNVRCSAGHRIG
ncbi:MAG TPA: 2-amino-4-hydroxy-6-hydroxymethyldihydropteridine diphosphokinase, partial [Acidimicrobiia bacterium]|nr:2-amino-4-hydroxy-6-hydroxymethyldihydropteridine diphosphokinase [Acidimicrobiia bacterium]